MFVGRERTLLLLTLRVLGPDESIFVTPKDIVNPNPRLNLAFAATLFNAFPDIGPSKEEISTMEEEIKQLKLENADLALKLVTS